MRVVKQLNMPYGIAFNSLGEMIVSERGGHQVSVFDVGGQKIRTFGSRGDRLEQMIYPSGIAVDDTDNIYVSSEHKLQKFTSSGELIKCIGRRVSKEAKFADPRGVGLGRLCSNCSLFFYSLILILFTHFSFSMYLFFSIFSNKIVKKRH